jgi:hypothetical protein
MRNHCSGQVKQECAACSSVVIVQAKMTEVAEHRVSLQVALYLIPLSGLSKPCSRGTSFTPLSEAYPQTEAIIMLIHSRECQW